MHHRGKSVRMGLTPSDVNIKKTATVLKTQAQRTGKI